MNDQRVFWNDRFSREGFFYGMNPNVYVASIIDALPPRQHILFLGEGEGRNALYAALQGHKVTALDASEIGLEKCKSLAKEAGVEIETEHLYLEEWNPKQHYNAILSSYLHLPEPLRTNVFSRSIQHLLPDGIFGGEFFSLNQLPKTSGGPKDPSLLYTVEQLKSILDPLSCSILELKEMETNLQEGAGHNGVASVIRLKVQA